MTASRARAMTPAYVTPGDVATLLATTPSTVHRAIARGDLPAIRYGGVVRIRKVDLDAFIARFSTDPLATRRRRGAA